MSAAAKQAVPKLIGRSDGVKTRETGLVKDDPIGSPPPDLNPSSPLFYQADESASTYHKNLN